MHGTRREQGISARASASRQTAICCRVQATGRNAKEKTHLDQDAPQSFREIAKRAFRGFNYFPTLLLTIWMSNLQDGRRLTTPAFLRPRVKLERCPIIRRGVKPACV